jgi:hypothetical protein
VKEREKGCLCDEGISKEREKECLFDEGISKREGKNVRLTKE